jgi:zinc D-Ala-D-Ala carboxypeptidase
VKSWLLSLVLASACVFAACGTDANGAPVIVTTPTPLPSGAPTQPAGEGQTPPGEAPTEPGENSETPAVETPAEATQPTGDNGSQSTPTPDGTVIVACGDILAPVDKQHRLPADCAPGDLVALPEAYSAAVPQYMRAEAADAAVRLFEAAIADGVYIYAISSYRSYQDQVYTFEYHVGNLGEEEAARVSARPGHSEHQLGTTTDVVSASSGYTLDGFVGTPEADWVAENAWRFGFVVSYPAGMEAVTGYVYEPWHIRYVGEAVAADVQASGLTLGQYLHSR